jgi:hypothetical protein
MIQRFFRELVPCLLSEDNITSLSVTFFIHRSEIYVALSLHYIGVLNVIATNGRAGGVGFLLANCKEILGMINNWAATAFNQVPHSANEIHGDKVAKDFGFEGGLVPGVTVSAYLIHPAIDAWGLEFVSRGHAHVRVVSPLYDAENFQIRVDEASKLDEKATSYTAVLSRPDGTVSANAEIHLANAEQLVSPPTMRGDTIADRETPAVEAIPENMGLLKKNGCHAFKFHWHEDHEMRTYLQNSADMPQLLRIGDRGDGYANMSFILGCSNWVLARVAHMNPWVHLETTSQNFMPIPFDTKLIAEMEVLDFYSKKGHEFVDVRVNLFNADSEKCHSSIDLRAIYKLRGT